MSMHRWRLSIGVAALAWLLAVGSSQGDAPTSSELIPLQPGAHTTRVDGPLRPDGTVDYIAAVNAMLSEGVTPANNAAVVVAQLMDRWPNERIRQATFAQLGVDVPGPDAVHFVSLGGFLDEHEPGERPHGLDAWDAPYGQAMDGPWSAEALPWLAQWVAEQSDALDRLAAAAQRERYWMPWVEDAEGDLLYDVPLPALGQLREMSRGFTARAHLRLHEGDLAGALADVLAVKRLGHRMKEAPLALDQLVGISLGAMSRVPLLSIIASETLTSAQARLLIAQLEPTAGGFPVERSIDIGERFVLLDVLQRLPASGKHPTLELSGPGSTMRYWPMDDWIATRYLDRNRALRRANEVYDRLVEAMRLPDYPARQDRQHELDDRIGQRSGEAMAEFFLPWGMPALLGPDLTDAQRVELYSDRVADGLLGMLLPASAPTDRAATHAQMTAQLELVALALAGYHAEHGRYPATLDALSPDWLGSTPRDLFAADGRAVRYRLEPQRVVVYSVGLNGEDQGGLDAQPWDEGDVVLQWGR